MTSSSASGTAPRNRRLLTGTAFRDRRPTSPRSFARRIFARFGGRLATLFTLPLLLLSGCAEEPFEESVKEMSDEEVSAFAESLADDVTLNLEDGLEASLWAPEGLVSDPAGINFDDEGRAWVATTHRRRSTVPDAGAVSFWFNDNLSWNTVEDRENFLMRELVPENSEDNEWLTDWNEDGIYDWQDMLVERDSVYVVEDLTGNGRANRARIMDWDSCSVVTEITGSALLHRGDLFVARIPDLLRVRDTNGDGKWNEAESLAHGFGNHFGYSGHGMSGLKVGPDGRIYLAIGDVGVNVVDADGKSWHYPHEGAIMRMDPDGSNFEVYAAGLRNIHEFDFDKYGNLIAVDNDGPVGDFDRLVYLIDGSDSGWRIYWQMGKFTDPKNNDYSVWVDEEYFNTRFDGQASHVLPPINDGFRGPSGFVYNPGTALSEEWADHFFASTFVGSTTHSGVQTFTLNESGAAFELNERKVILRGLLSTSLGFSPDGSLFTADWIQGWVTKGTGRLWRIDTPEDQRHPAREETQRLLASDVSTLAADDLTEFLAHQDMRVRKKAQFELVAREEIDSLLGVAMEGGDQMARLHGIWGVAQAARTGDIELAAPLTDLLTDEDPKIRAQAAKMLGDVRYESAGEELVPLLGDEHPRVRLFAAEAIGRIGYSDGVEPLVEMVRAADGSDIYLRQAGAIALARLGDADALSPFIDDPSVEVRTVTLMALNRLDSPHVVRFLEDSEEALVTDAARAINDEDFIEEGMAPLSRMLEQDIFTGEPLLRRAINVSLYGGTLEDAQRLANFAQREDISEALRVEALETLTYWEEPSELDRVSGRYRGPVTGDPELAREALEPALARLLDDGSEAVRIAGLKAAGSLDVRGGASDMRRLAAGDRSVDVRVAALQALHAVGAEGMDEVISLALDDGESRVRMTALSMIEDLDPDSGSTVALLESILDSGSVEEKQAAVEILSRTGSAEAVSLLEGQVDQLIAGEVEPEIQLDLVLAAEASSDETIQEKITQYQSAKQTDDWVDLYREALYGGNRSEGERIFANHADAQCYRCHADGGQAAPELDNIGTILNREDLLLALVDPNDRIAPGYGMVSVTQSDGETVQGVFRGETETAMMVSAGEQQWEIDWAEIVEKTWVPSAMPAMGDILTREEIRDLIAYMASLQE